MRMRAFIKALILCAAAMWGGAGAVGAGEIILYAGINFTGDPVRLTQSTPDLGNFDNRANSVRVVSGSWELFYDANFQSDFGPSKVLTPGDYPNLNTAAAGFFSGRLSSVRLFVERPTTLPGAVQTCTGPYRVVLGQRCMWACGPNSSPDETGNRCSCNSGYVGRGTDSRGRVRCLASAGTLVPTPAPADAIYNVPGGAAFEVARANGFSFYVDTPAGDTAECAYQIMPGGALGLNVTYEISLIPGLRRVGDVCVFRMFGSRQLAAGWSFFGRIDPDSDVCGAGWLEFINESYAENPAFQISILADVNYKPSLGRNCLIHRWTISRFRLRGPAGADWRNAFQ